jgi:hypothetical protein
MAGSLDGVAVLAHLMGCSGLPGFFHGGFIVPTSGSTSAYFADIYDVC